MANREIFVPTRDTVATPPPPGKRKKPQLSADQNIYLAKKRVGKFLFDAVSLVLILGLCFVILYPFIKLVPSVLSNLDDLGNPKVIWIPEQFDTTSFTAAAHYALPSGLMTMAKSVAFALVLMVIQVFVSAMTGYTIARVKYKFLTPVMFMMVILAFLVPRQSLLLAQYVYFNNFDAAGLLATKINLIGNPASLYAMAILGFGVNQSLMILIFSQFFKNIPKELEEASLIDGCGFYGNYFRIMVPNAIPAIVIVAILSFVWNYGDTYYTNYFYSEGKLIASNLSMNFIDANKVNIQKVLELRFGLNVWTDMVFDSLKQAGVLIFLAPLVVLYLFAQRWLVENLENSGLVG